jgi:hypothetical protein
MHTSSPNQYVLVVEKHEGLMLEMGDNNNKEHLSSKKPTCQGLPKEFRAFSSAFSARSHVSISPRNFSGLCKIERIISFIAK